MNPAQVLQVLDRLDANGVTGWLDGGWGVDAVLGEQTRPHEDLDLASPEAIALAPKRRSPRSASSTHPKSSPDGRPAWR
jgi:hypothetical protein